VTKRRLLAEFTGTGLLVAIVVGSGIAATRLTPDGAVRLLVNSVVTALGLAVLILVAGAVGGAALADAMFAAPALAVSTTRRGGGPVLLGEVVATAGLLLLIVTLARTGRTGQAAWSVGAWIGAAYWFTSSTSFANPAVTIGRTLTDTYAGIAPASAPAFIAAEIIGAAVGVLLAVAVHPKPKPDPDPVPLTG
jgi:glycerol uptake facilitator-like aquaporin